MAGVWGWYTQSYSISAELIYGGKKGEILSEGVFLWSLVLRRFFIEFSKCDIKQVCWVRGKKG